MGGSWQAALEKIVGPAEIESDPALEHALDELNRLAKGRLPESYLAFLRRKPCHCRADAFGDFSMLCVEQAIQYFAPTDADHEEMDRDIADHTDRRIRRIIRSPDWVPIAEFNGDVWLYLDFAPKRTGRPGQVIQLDPEALSWHWIAASFDDLLNDLDKGRVLDPDLGTEADED